ncbi:aminoglycoside phosphotransferase family protein [Allokutzneria sp. A3M-2-11 16]|uniref:phosphotransferase n=1 Tax=Allokutzneria sp. A3M-2-11 16 TaxID=2962043 RepID=UPI0020B89383|nr:phosphotransferase [Allokutzneria sp. A3M-2-11 16]MCP3802571.1 aminoglycoside phosphotransferase family protein [Allokutzneria sp. A3M-2-11 16]
MQLWASDPWRREAVAWMDAQLVRAGMVRTGEVTQPRVQSWATVLRAETNQGVVWLKACGPGTAFEVPLYPLLHRLAPDRVLTPIAVDLDREWLLLPDGGPTMKDSPRDLAEVLAGYAKLQRDLAPHVDELLAIGVVDMRAAIMPKRFTEAMEAVGAYVERRGGEAERTTFDQLVAFEDTYREWCERLAEDPIPPSLDHNDLHQSNVFATGAKFYDWGDSVVAHPFASLLLPLSRNEDHRVRDAYLAGFGPPAELVASVELACRVGKVARTLVWIRALGGDVDHEYASAPLEHMASLLSESYLL